MKYLFIVLTALTLSLNAQIITTVAGNGTQGYSGDGGQAINAELYFPTGIAVDASGNLYIADFGNGRIREVSMSGVIITIAGSSTGGFSGDGGQATNATLNAAEEIILDAADNLYIADNGNNRIRKITKTTGIINTVAGGGTSGLGDGGQATLAELAVPYGVVPDVSGNLYIVDTGNNRVRKVNTNGIISTLAGIGTANYSGDGGQATAAELNAPNGLTIDAAGNVYIADAGNNVIRKINSIGVITTIVGNGSGAGSGFGGYGGDGGQATASELNYPFSVSFDASGNLYIADTQNNRIRKVTNVGVAGIEQVANINEEVMVYPNPAAKSIQVSLAGNSEDAMLVIRDMLGNVVYHSTTNAAHNTIPVSEFAGGVYIIEVSNSKGIAFKKFIKE